MASERLIYKDEFGETHTTDEKINGKFVGDRAVREKLFEYEQEESEGKLIHLPCKIGDTVYYIAEKFVKRGRKKIAIKYFESGIVDNIQLGQIMVPQVTVCNEDNTWITFDAVRDLGKTVFLTPEAAGKALNNPAKPDN